MIDTLLLSRIQFGLSLGVHFIFPSLTLGLAIYVVAFESAFMITKRLQYRAISSFLVKLLSLIFTLGIATGILLPFSIGATWAKFSIFSGQLFGAQLAIEAFTAFAIESICIGILLFGRERVRPAIYLSAAIAVFLASHVSAFWIISANSWMQTPAGYSVVNGTVVLVDFWKAILNPSAIVRFEHVIMAAWLTGTVAVCGIAAWFVRRLDLADMGRRILRVGMPIFAVMALAQLVVGHGQVMNVIRHQPAKQAAYDGMFFSRRGAPLYIFGIPDAGHQTIHVAFGVPKLLSFLESFNFNSEVKGLEAFDPKTLPPINVIFTTFHAMVAIGLILIGTGLIGLFLLLRHRLFKSKWFLLLLSIIAPLPLLANELGWIGAEIGRQPWVVYGLLRTRDAISPALQGGRVLVTFIMLSLVQTVILASFIWFGLRIVKEGPSVEESREKSATMNRGS